MLYHCFNHISFFFQNPSGQEQAEGSTVEGGLQAAHLMPAMASSPLELATIGDCPEEWSY